MANSDSDKQQPLHRQHLRASIFSLFFIVYSNNCNRRPYLLVAMQSSASPPRHSTASPELRESLPSETSDDQPDASEDLYGNASQETLVGANSAKGQENRPPMTPIEEAAGVSSSRGTPTTSSDRASRHPRTPPGTASEDSARKTEQPRTPRISFAELPARHGHRSQTSISSAYRRNRGTVRSRPEELPETETFGASGITIHRRPRQGGPANDGSRPSTESSAIPSLVSDRDSGDEESEDENDQHSSDTDRTPVPNAGSAGATESGNERRSSETHERPAPASFPRFSEAHILPPPYTPRSSSDDSGSDSSGTKKRKQDAIAETQNNGYEPDDLASEGIVERNSQATNTQTDCDGGSPKQKKGKTAVREPVGELMLDRPRPVPRRDSPNRGRRLRTIAQTGFQSHAFRSPSSEDLNTEAELLRNEDDGDAQQPPVIPVRNGEIAQFPAGSTADLVDGQLQERRSLQLLVEQFQAYEQADASGADETEIDDTGAADTGADETGADGTAADDTGSDDTEAGDTGSDKTEADDTGANGTGDEFEEDDVRLPEAEIHRVLNGELWNDNPPFPGNE